MRNAQRFPGRLGRFAVGLLMLVWTPAAQAYITAPVQTLGQLCNSTYVTVVRVEKVNKERGLIVYRKVHDLKGTYPRDVLRHVFDWKNTPAHKGAGDVPVRPDEKDWKYAVQWAEVGKTAIVFSLKYDPYGDFGHTYIDGLWYATMCPQRDWDLWYSIYADPALLSRWHCGSPEQLVAALKEILAGKDAVVPVLAGGSKDDLRAGKGKLHGLRVSLRLGNYDPKRDAVPWQETNVLLPSFPRPEPLKEAVLFAFDTVGFPERKNVTLELIQGQTPRRVLPTGPKGSHDEHWGYFTILRIGELFHLWVMTQSADTQYLCYATSKDGIQWQKPELGLVEFNGSKKNNIVESPFKLRSPKCEDILTTFLVHFDPDEPRPERRYRMAAQLIQGGSGKLALAYSPDGLRWKAGPAPKAQFMEMGGSIQFKGKYYLTGQSTMPRRLNVFASTDFENWTDLGSGFSRDHLPPLEQEKPSPLPNADKWAPAGIGKGEQVHCGAGLWNRGNVILGVYDAWHGREKDRRLITMDLGLVVSHDAVRYTEPVPSFRLVDAHKQPAVPPHGPALTGGKLENVGDKTHCWYTWWHPPEGQHGTYVVSWERDRLGLLKPNAATGASVISAPVQISRGSAGVFVNAGGLDKDNRLRISLLDEKGQPIAGFSGADAAMIDKNGLRVPVTWKGGQALSADLRKAKIQVTFEGTQGRLHAVYVGTP